jgi:chromosome segregation ATPase
VDDEAANALQVVLAKRRAEEIAAEAAKPKSNATVLTASSQKLVAATKLGDQARSKIKSKLGKLETAAKDLFKQIDEIKSVRDEILGLEKEVDKASKEHAKVCEQHASQASKKPAAPIPICWQSVADFVRSQAEVNKEVAVPQEVIAFLETSFPAVPKAEEAAQAGKRKNEQEAQQEGPGGDDDMPGSDAESENEEDKEDKQDAAAAAGRRRLKAKRTVASPAAAAADPKEAGEAAEEAAANEPVEDQAVRSAKALLAQVTGAFDEVLRDAGTLAAASGVSGDPEVPKAPAPAGESPQRG